QRVPTQVDLPLSPVAVVRGAVELEVDTLRLGVHVQVDAAAADADPYLPPEPRHPGTGEDPKVSPDLEGTLAAGGEQAEQVPQLSAVGQPRRRAERPADPRRCGHPAGHGPDGRYAPVPRRQQRPGVHEERSSEVTDRPFRVTTWGGSGAKPATWCTWNPGCDRTRTAAGTVTCTASPASWSASPQTANAVVWLSAPRPSSHARAARRRSAGVSGTAASRYTPGRIRRRCPLRDACSTTQSGTTCVARSRVTRPRSRSSSALS